METELGISIEFEIDEKDCPCQGTGWSKQPDWVECPIHHHGQLHPEAKILLLDEPGRLAEEERKSYLRWRIDQVRDFANDLTQKLRQASYELVQLELELINKTPTIPNMAAIVEPRE